MIRFLEIEDIKNTTLKAIKEKITPEKNLEDIKARFLLI